MRRTILLGGAFVSSCLTAVNAVGNAGDIVPFAQDQEVAMKVNGDSLSGVPEEYVAGRVTVRGHGAAAAGGQLKFEVIKQPKWGQFGWNNSVSGEFIYSPRDYSLPTTNHGVEAEVPIPGCKYECENCPNAIGDLKGVTLAHPPVLSPIDCGSTDENDADFIPCDGLLTCCEGYVSTLRNPDNNQLIAIASTQQKRWVVGYECPTMEDGAWTQAEQDEYDRAMVSNTDDITVSDDIIRRIECADVPPRLCVTHMAKVPYDEFKFRAMNDFGHSNWATVKIVFDRSDSAAGFLQFTVLCAFILMTMTCCGLLRVIALQLVLQPGRRYEICGKFCGTFCAPPPETYVLNKSGADYKPDFLKEGYEETENPILDDDDE